MSNVTEFQFPSSTTEEEIDTDRQIQAALKRKSNNLRRRQDFLATCNLPEKFKGLKNADAGEIFAVLKSLRWRIHSATTKYNLSVAQRRRHSPRDKYMSFAGQNTTSLTLSRICLSMYCEGYSIKHKCWWIGPRNTTFPGAVFTVSWPKRSTRASSSPRMREFITTLTKRSSISSRICSGRYSIQKRTSYIKC